MVVVTAVSFIAKAADVVGLYIAPPENAIVICVDEKPSIQALERAQGYLKLPNALLPEGLRVMEAWGPDGRRGLLFPQRARAVGCFFASARYR
jgi:hypothetical protein